MAYLNDVFRCLEAEIPDTRDVILLKIGMLLQDDLDDPDEMLRWLTSPNKCFRGERPIDLMKTNEGLSEICAALMVHGVSSLGM
jgi:uncharacterized protein (DUF2384 family)